MKLQGAVAVVTGGGSGLGAALGRELVGAGATPVILDLRADRVDRMVRELGRPGVQAAGWVCDVAERGQVESTFAEIGARFGRIDLLVNCAGRSMFRRFLDMTDDDIDWVLGPNLLGVVHTIRAAARFMPRGSRIVNVTSVSGRVPTPGEAFYSAVKAAVVSLSESLEAELACRGIGVTVVLPGGMSTALFAEHSSWELRPDLQRRMERPPEHMARAIKRAVRSDRFDVVAPSYMRAVLLVQRIAPGFFRRGVRWYYSKLVEPRIRGSLADS